MLPSDYLSDNLDKYLELDGMRILPLWFDSMGAKSMATFIKTDDKSIIIDPAAAIMQPSYPMEESEKEEFLEYAMERIRKYCRKSNVVIITHYHYDHHKKPEEVPESYIDKTVYLKNPNIWINYSQWKRSRVLYTQLIDLIDCKLDIDSLKKDPEELEIEDPYNSLKKVREKDFGDYEERHEELLRKWRARMFQSAEIWKKGKWLKEFSCDNTHIKFIGDEPVKYGELTIRFPGPMFHGIEYAKTGWIEPVIFEYRDHKFLFSSDIQGPTIEDYREWIISENPDIIFMDGPSTYLLGYMLNKTNLNRIIDNVTKIVKNVDFELMIYDHHLPRDKKFRKRMQIFFDRVEEMGKRVMTAAEWFGMEPLIEIL